MKIDMKYFLLLLTLFAGSVIGRAESEHESRGPFQYYEKFFNNESWIRRLVLFVKALREDAGFSTHLSSNIFKMLRLTAEIEEINDELRDQIIPESNDEFGWLRKVELLNILLLGAQELNPHYLTRYDSELAPFWKSVEIDNYIGATSPVAYNEEFLSSLIKIERKPDPNSISASLRTWTQYNVELVKAYAAIANHESYQSGFLRTVYPDIDKLLSVASAYITLLKETRLIGYNDAVLKKFSEQIDANKRDYPWLTDPELSAGSKANMHYVTSRKMHDLLSDLNSSRKAVESKLGVDALCSSLDVDKVCNVEELEMLRKVTLHNRRIKLQTLFLVADVHYLNAVESTRWALSDWTSARRIEDWDALFWAQVASASPKAHAEYKRFLEERIGPRN